MQRKHLLTSSSSSSSSPFSAPQSSSVTDANVEQTGVDEGDEGAAEKKDHDRSLHRDANAITSETAQAGVGVGAGASASDDDNPPHPILSLINTRQAPGSEYEVIADAESGAMGEEDGNQEDEIRISAGRSVFEGSNSYYSSSSSSSSSSFSSFSFSSSSSSSSSSFSSSSSSSSSSSFTTHLDAT